VIAIAGKKLANNCADFLIAKPAPPTHLVFDETGAVGTFSHTTQPEKLPHWVKSIAWAGNLAAVFRENTVKR